MEENQDLKDKLIALRKSKGMNRRQFCEHFEIPYMTVSDWEHGNRRVPSYLLRLLEYYIRIEQLTKDKGDSNSNKTDEKRRT